MPESLRVEVARSLAGVDAAAWNALGGDDDPFTDHEFLVALERSRVVGEGTPWRPRHVLAWRGRELVGAMPVYLRWDSYGEYIFDFGWAEAWARAGLRYYPKGVAAVPFTPVTGARILLARGLSLEADADADVRADAVAVAREPAHGAANAGACDAGADSVGRGREVAAAMVDAALALSVEEGLSGLHVLFSRKAEHEFLSSRGFLSRVTHQYHWENRGYRTFDDWLADLRSKKRKQVLHERAEVAAQGLDIEVLEGDEIRPHHVDAIWRFYLATAARKWSEPYLVRETFEELASTWRHRLLLVLASHDGRPVAGTFNVRGSRTVFGRYWGAEGHWPSLHFECCYWRLVDYAIAHGMQAVEAGAQGEHKFLRGFAARPTWSSHWLAHEGGRRAVADFLERERAHNAAIIDAYNRVSPVKSERSRGQS